MSYLLSCIKVSVFCMSASSCLACMACGCFSKKSPSKSKSAASLSNPGHTIITVTERNLNTSQVEDLSALDVIYQQQTKQKSRTKPAPASPKQITQESPSSSEEDSVSFVQRAAKAAKSVVGAVVTSRMGQKIEKQMIDEAMDFGEKETKQIPIIGNLLSQEISELEAQEEEKIPE